jgi:hypothetical protein
LAGTRLLLMPRPSIPTASISAMPPAMTLPLSSATPCASRPR